MSWGKERNSHFPMFGYPKSQSPITVEQRMGIAHKILAEFLSSSLAAVSFVW